LASSQRDFLFFIGLFSIVLAQLWSDCGAAANSGSTSRRFLLILPDLPGPSPDPAGQKVQVPAFLR